MVAPESSVYMCNYLLWSHINRFKVWFIRPAPVTLGRKWILFCSHLVGNKYLYHIKESLREKEDDGGLTHLPNRDVWGHSLSSVLKVHVAISHTCLWKLSRRRALSSMVALVRKSPARDPGRFSNSAMRCVMRACSLSENTTWKLGPIKALTATLSEWFCQDHSLYIYTWTHYPVRQCSLGLRSCSFMQFSTEDLVYSILNIMNIKINVQRKSPQ